MAATRATRVLLVDDESLVRRILKEILAAYQDLELVGEAANGNEAISAVGRLQPDVVVMDIRMPALDGIAAARVIRDKYRHVKIIGLSEYAQSYVCTKLQHRCDGTSWGSRRISKIDGVGRTLLGN